MLEGVFLDTHVYKHVFPYICGIQICFDSYSSRGKNNRHIDGYWMYFGKDVVTHTTNHEFDNLWYSKFDGVS